MNAAQTLLPRVAHARSPASDAQRPQAAAGRSYGWWVLIAAFVAAAVPGLAFANCVLNHFYLQGAYLWDSGAIAGVIWRRDAWLTYPPLFPIGSLYAYHVMPLLSVLTVASRYVSIGLPGWFALVIGIGHALPSIGLFWLLMEGLGLRSKGGLAAAVVLAVLAAFTGIPLATILFPHPEIIIAGGLTLVFAAIALEHYWIAAACLIFTLLVREDAGLHAFGVIFLLVMVNWIRGISWRQQAPLLILALICFVYSAGAVAFKQLAFPEQQSLFAAEYLNHPLFSDASLRRVLLSAIGLPVYRGYFFWPAIAAVIWSILARNALIMLGYLAFCPWLLMNLQGNGDIRETISGYYSFPFLVALVWPLAAVVIDAHQRGVGPDARAALAGFTVMLALSFVGLPRLWNPGHMDLWTNFTTLPSLARAEATDRAVAVLLANESSGAGSSFGTLFTDQSVYSLAPYDFDSAAVVQPVERSGRVWNVPIDSFAYFEVGPDIERMRGTMAMRDLTYAYRFKGTSIRLVSNRDLDSVAGLERLPAGSVAHK